MIISPFSRSVHKVRQGSHLIGLSLMIACCSTMNGLGSTPSGSATLYVTSTGMPIKLKHQSSSTLEMRQT